MRRCEFRNVKLRKRTDDSEFAQQRDRSLDRQTDDICVRAVDPFDNRAAGALRSVRSGFVERIDLAKICGDVALAQFEKCHVRQLANQPAAFQVSDNYRRIHLVCAAAQLAQKSTRLSHVGRFAENRSVKRNVGVRGENDCVWPVTQDSCGFAQRVERRELARSQIRRLRFVCFAYDNIKFEAGCSEQIAPARRSRCENEPACYGFAGDPEVFGAAGILPLNILPRSPSFISV